MVTDPKNKNLKIWYELISYIFGSIFSIRWSRILEYWHTEENVQRISGFYAKKIILFNFIQSKDILKVGGFPNNYLCRMMEEYVSNLKTIYFLPKLILNWLKWNVLRVAVCRSFISFRDIYCSWGWYSD